MYYCLKQTPERLFSCFMNPNQTAKPSRLELLFGCSFSNGLTEWAIFIIDTLVDGMRRCF